MVGGDVRRRFHPLRGRRLAILAGAETAGGPMNYQIYAGIDRERLVSLIPSRLKPRLPEDEVYTLILVRSSIRVARSAILSKALEEIGDDPGRLVAAANAFTKDALEALNARGALVVAGG